MEEVGSFYLLLHPRPAYVIGSGRWGERVNFMAASWVSPVGEEPPSLIVALGKESLTLELIEIYGEFTVNVIPISLVEELYYVGSRSGRDEDKSRVFRAERGEKVSAPIVKDSLGVLECKLMKEVELGDVKLVIGEVLSAKADKRFFNERAGWDFKKVNIPLHNWGRGFFKVGGFVMAKGKV